jgi:hypothetical protein
MDSLNKLNNFRKCEIMVMNKVGKVNSAHKVDLYALVRVYRLYCRLK